MQNEWLTIIKEGDDVTLDSCFPKAVGEIVIPDGVTKIQDYAFDQCNKVTSLVIPSSVNDIDNSSFLGCINLQSIIVDPNNTIYDSRNNCNAIIETATNTLVKGCQNTIIPNGIRTIGVFAFCECIGLSSIILPESLEYIEESSFAGTGLTKIHIPYNVKWIGEGAFNVCPNLRSVEVPDQVAVEHPCNENYYPAFDGVNCTFTRYKVL